MPSPQAGGPAHDLAAPPQGRAAGVDVTIGQRRAAPSGRRALARIEVDYANDPDRCLAVIASLMNEYEEYVSAQHAICRGCPVDRAGPFIVHSMLEWKAIYGDGRLGHWTRDDIGRYLLDHFPRKVSADRQLRRDTPTCVRDFVYFMSDRGTLAGDELDVLADAGDELFDEFLAANKDRRNWGLAKRVLRGGAAFIDLDDDRYVDLATFPPASPDPAPPTYRTGSGTPAERAKRKAARTARKRNRR